MKVVENLFKKKLMVKNLFIEKTYVVGTYDHIRGLSKKFVEFVNKNKSTNVVALKFLHVKDPFKPDKICEFQTNR